jgi:dehydrogenase/reductase SDR family protein 7B
MRYDESVIWVTGASSGIGQAVAREVLGRGARVIASARNVAALERLQQESPDPAAIHVLPLDLTDSAAIAKASRDALAVWGRIDGLMHCAGMSQRSMVRDTIPEVDRRLMEVNFFGPVQLTKAVLPSMLARRSGTIVVISSLAGKFGTPMRSAYSASKHALHGFFDSMRAELRNDGIHITIVCPGYVQTEITLRSLTGDGSTYGRVDLALRHGMPVAACAKAIADAAGRGKEEVLLGGREKYAALVHRFFPRLFSRLVSRARPR